MTPARKRRLAKIEASQAMLLIALHNASIAEASQQTRLYINQLGIQVNYLSRLARKAL